ncbi:SGNH/GDSL hydrolase family protein [Leuconostoc gelidum subsp. gasicomitatum]|uniref:SGNH/GDSL hydrolase family protein n=1 Tax=Leuconostoc gasicomitatum TaxID=115778 RepID=UPI001CC6AE1D|nr:SGNH/GDSL hydrolase family protein [Leuconostoc gasicomitatum]MBZ5960959.1 SGNH/GDSL hydrolase family protein [Leuconostoc gasicomitatum]MBZ5993688.1 SGNH/GDSL hydrolase family protein [Leuconostoc gasicomitatum]
MLIKIFFNFKKKLKSKVKNNNYLQSSELKSVQTIGIIGDSVSFGLKSSMNYGQYLQKITGGVVQNLAYSGAHLSDNGRKSIFQQSQYLDLCDLYILQGTDDDWLANVPIGHKDDTAKQSYIGAFYQTVSQLHHLNSTAKIIIVSTTCQTPVWGNVVRRTDKTENMLGHSLHDYMIAQEKACADLKLPFVNLMRQTLFDPSKKSFRKKYMPDGLHPNKEGHQIIANEIVKIYKQNFGS